ncbi:uncharacterized protein EV422DRAFT_532599 [Fimicolochytrium jonesii]|uniref:uncharacterized protein n=1 Tax=Fimicolochytrium jonesii TaxID=1396493 RepID=UPI0022FEE727|nr:uncharacterized protein EV422DRAFT_532599 [Fimicolochytrium jonesii]KAI8819871.1 hypothetical protein EV422DRAFT_532599 [Fimicolochytrium jonesii]
MARVARLLLFSAITFLIVIALGYAVFGYMVFLNTSPFPATKIFPRKIVIGLCILSPLVLTTSLLGCCGLHRSSAAFLHSLVVALTFLCIGHYVLAHLAHLETNIVTAELGAYSDWNSSNANTRTSIMNEFRCCQWSAADIEGSKAHAPAAISTPGIADDGDASTPPVVYDSCLAGAGPCENILTDFRVTLAPKIAIACYAVIGYLLLTLSIDAALIYAMRDRRKRRAREKHWRNAVGDEGLLKRSMASV